jgi:hypothetical protein
VDGKVTLNRQQILMEQPSGRLWAAMVPPNADSMQEDFLELVRREYGCSATLEGSGSLVVDGAEPAPLPPYESDPAELYTDFLLPEATDQPSPPHMWFTVVDGRGRIHWTEKQPGWNVLVLVCRSTPADSPRRPGWWRVTCRCHSVGTCVVEPRQPQDLGGGQPIEDLGQAPD